MICSYLRFNNRLKNTKFIGDFSALCNKVVLFKSIETKYISKTDFERGEIIVNLGWDWKPLFLVVQ